MIKRLKIKFVCINMLIVTVMLAMIFGFVLYSTNREMEEQGYRTLQTLHEGSQHRDFLSRERRIPYFAVKISPQGEFQLFSHFFFDDARDEELVNIARDVYEENRSMGVLKELSLRFSRKHVPDGEIIVFMDISMERGILTGLIKTCIRIALLSYFLFFAISVLLAHWAIRPVDTAWKNQRQFVADASHELKTPLTVIMTNAELLQDDSYGESSREQFALSILAMSRQMRGLVEGLLELSRVDNGVVKITFTEVDLSELVSDSLLPFEPMFFERGMELCADVERGLLLCGSEPHLRQVADILLDNAVKYGCSEKPVQVSLQRQGRYARFAVTTAGEDISRQDLKNIFKRFYRIDKARSMNHSYGLGLSIAEGIVREHRGKIWAESRNGLNSFIVLLPVMSGKPESRIEKCG